MGTNECNLTEDAGINPLRKEHTLQNTTKANTHTRRLQSVKYLPTVQKCGSSICSAKVSVHPVAGLKLWNTVQANRVTSDAACVFIYKAGVVVRGWGGGGALPRSSWGHTILPTWIHKWIVGSTATPCRTGPWLARCAAGINTLGVYIGVKVWHFQEKRETPPPPLKPNPLQKKKKDNKEEDEPPQRDVYIILTTDLKMRAQIQKVPQILELLKKKSVGLQHFKPTSSVCVLEEKDAVEVARCPHAASRAHSLDAIPGPTNWPLVGSLVELLRKGGLTRQHEALVQ